MPRKSPASSTKKAEKPEKEPKAAKAAKAEKPAKAAKAAKAAEVVEAPKSKQSRNMIPSATARRSMVSQLSDAGALAEIEALKEERRTLEPAAAREELRGGADQDKPSNRRMTLELMKQHATKKHVKRWIEINERLHELSSSPLIARGNASMGKFVSRLIEWLIAEILKKLTVQAHKNERRRLNPHFLPEAQSGEPFYDFMPLIENLPAWREICEECDQEHDEDDVEDQDQDEGEEDHDEDDEDQDQDDEDHDDVDVDEVVCVSIKTKSATRKLNHQLQEITTYKTNVHHKLYTFINDVVEQLMFRLANMCQILLQMKNQRTIKEDLIQHAIRIIYADNYMKKEGEALLKHISHTYIPEKAETQKNEDGEKVRVVLQELVLGDAAGCDFSGVEPLPPLKTKQPKKEPAAPKADAKKTPKPKKAAK